MSAVEVATRGEVIEQLRVQCRDANRRIRQRRKDADRIASRIADDMIRSGTTAPELLDEYRHARGELRSAVDEWVELSLLQRTV